MSTFIRIAFIATIKSPNKKKHMKTILLLVTVMAVIYQSYGQNEVPSAEIQIKSALLAAPKEKRDSCTVYGYSNDKQFMLLRKGTNELICVADDPNQPGFSVACYFKELDPFMQRGRELRKQGMNDQQVYDEREKEVKAGALHMPTQPAAMFVYSADDKDFNKTTGEVANAYLRSVIYIAYATVESTGLPDKPSGKGMPWIMNPGTYRAHIMINP